MDVIEVINQLSINREDSLNFPGGPNIKSQEPLKAEKGSKRGSRELWQEGKADVKHKKDSMCCGWTADEGARSTQKGTEDLSPAAARN